MPVVVLAPVSVVRVAPMMVGPPVAVSVSVAARVPVRVAHGVVVVEALRLEDLDVAPAHVLPEVARCGARGGGFDESRGR